MTGNERTQRVAIVLVNGFDRKGHWGRYSRTEAVDYPWIDLCLRQIDRYTVGWDYEILVFDNSHLKVHRDIIQRYPQARAMPGKWVASLGRFADRMPLRPVSDLLERRHPKALDYLVRRVARDVDFIVTLDTDSFPVRGDWLDVLVTACEQGAGLAGVYRDEMAPTIEPFIHVSGLCVRQADLRSLGVSFGRGKTQDVGQNITEAVLRCGRQIAPLHRGNRRNFHFLIGGLYGDIIYHHGAGSRRAKFWTSTDLDEDERIRVTLRDAAFRDVDHLVAVLRGEVSNNLGLKVI